MKHRTPGGFTRSRLIEAAKRAYLNVGAIAMIAVIPGAAMGQSSINSNPDNSAPVRMARISYVSGDVSFRNHDSDEWSRAVRNLPLRQGAQITVTGSGRAEIMLDDGSRLRLGDGAVASFAVMYSDDNGEYTQITLQTGDAFLRLSKAPSVYQVDAPLASIDASGPARIQIDADNGLRTCVRQGSAVVQGKEGKVTLASGSSLYEASETTPYSTGPLPPQDTFGRWCASLDASEDHDLRDPDRKYEPANVAIMSDNLDDYGEWRTVPEYGRVWHPYHMYAGWRPYHDGHWVWEDPFGWTWVSAEPWGWAPYHYGTWVCEPYGWCWDPGPADQYWSPAMVDFYEAGADIAWCPLAPAEVVYPIGLSVGFGFGNWGICFSIGGCGSYYPDPFGVCYRRRWDNRFANDFRGGRFSGGGGLNRSTFVGNTNFVPRNARNAPGASIARASAFGGRGAYRSLPAGSTSAFRGGHYVGAPARGADPVAGPTTARPTAVSSTATRSFRAASASTRAALTRSVNHTASGALSPAVARQTLAQRSAGTRTSANGTRVSGATAFPHTAGTGAGTRIGSGSRIASSPRAVSNALASANRARAALGRPISNGATQTRAARQAGRIASAGAAGSFARTGTRTSAQNLNAQASPRRAASGNNGSTTRSVTRSVRSEAPATGRRIASAGNTRTGSFAGGNVRGRSTAQHAVASQPRRSFVPQRNFSQPRSNTPARQFSAPQRSFSAPQRQFAAPQRQFSAPQRASSSPPRQSGGSQHQDRRGR